MKNIMKREHKMKYKIGDKVRIRKDLKVEERYDGTSLTDKMLLWKGEKVTILKVCSDYNGYEIEEDGGCFLWTDSMLDNEMTNADKIRKMSDEELAEFLRTASWEEGNNMFTCDGIPNDVCKENDCKLCKGFLWWLQQPANL